MGGWITATVLGIVWAYLVRFVSVALQSVQSGYSRIPGSFDDSARMLGTAGFALLARVHWPLLRRSSTAAALLVFVDVMKELPATLVLRPFNTDTLAVVAYQLARDERLGEAALPSLALVLVGLIPVVLLSRALAVRPALVQARAVGAHSSSLNSARGGSRFSEDHLAGGHMDDADLLARRFGEALRGHGDGQGAVAEKILLGTGNRPQPAGDRVIAFHAEISWRHWIYLFLACLFALLVAHWQVPW